MSGAEGKGSMSAQPNLSPAQDEQPHAPLFTRRQLNFAAVFLGLAAPFLVALNWQRMRRNDQIVPTLVQGWIGGPLLTVLVLVVLRGLLAPGTGQDLAAEFGGLLIIPIVNRYLVWDQHDAYEEWLMEGGAAHASLSLGCFVLAVLGFVSSVIMLGLLLMWVAFS